MRSTSFWIILSAQKTKKVQAFLEQHSNVRLYFTPTYSFWLNQVEIWFAPIEREVIARGVSTSVKGLSSKLMRYIRAYSGEANHSAEVQRCLPSNPY
jgi:transposase